MFYYNNKNEINSFYNNKNFTKMKKKNLKNKQVTIKIKLKIYK